jgi:dTDP-4-amino-4,6-dideoxygalactose transaminase
VKRGQEGFTLVKQEAKEGLTGQAGQAQIDADYKGRRRYPCRVVGGEVAEDLFERGLCLPSGSNMTEADMGRIEKALRGIFGRRG